MLEDARKGGDYTTSIEVGCDIANAIRDDFEKNGDVKKPRKETTDDFYDLGGIGSPYYIIKSRIFSIPVENGNPKGATGLSSAATNKLKSVCGGTLPVCSWKLDEACVTSVLRNLKVGEVSFCGDAGFTDDNGKRVKFGNNNCGNSNYEDWANADLQRSCKEMCPGGDKINRFDQSGRENVENFGNVGPQDFVSTRSNVGSNRFVPECNIGDDACQPNYRYVLYWNRHVSGRYYEVQVLKIPKLMDLEYSQSVPGILQGIGITFHNGFLGSDAGARYRDLRQSVRVTFQQSENVLLNTFASDLERTIEAWMASVSYYYKDWTIEFQQCSDAADCLNNNLQKTEYLQIVDTNNDNSVKKVMEDQLNSVDLDALLRISQLPCDKTVKDFNRFYIRTPLNPNTDKLEPGKKYLLVMNQWRHTEFGEPYQEGCGGLVCSACMKGPCEYTTLAERDCILETKYGYGWTQRYRKRIVTAHKDFSLIILPIEDEAAIKSLLK